MEPKSELKLFARLATLFAKLTPEGQRRALAWLQATYGQSEVLPPVQSVVPPPPPEIPTLVTAAPSMPPERGSYLDRRTKFEVHRF